MKKTNKIEKSKKTKKTNAIKKTTITSNMQKEFWKHNLNPITGLPPSNKLNYDEMKKYYSKGNEPIQYTQITSNCFII